MTHDQKCDRQTDNEELTRRHMIRNVTDRQTHNEELTRRHMIRNVTDRQTMRN